MFFGVPVVAQWLMNPTRNHGCGFNPWSCWVKDLALRELWCRLQMRGSDPALLWLWCRPVATAPTRPLAWEPPYAAGVTLKGQKDKKKKKRIVLDQISWDLTGFPQIESDCVFLLRVDCSFIPSFSYYLLRTHCAGYPHEQDRHGP